jgi:Ran GTPase-activating protein (RanGAP) involved in mRNA processing and transport
LSNNSFGKASSSAWGSAIESSNQIKYLDFEGNSFGDGGVDNISDGMMRNQSLTFIDLSSNEMGNSGAQAFANVMRNKSRNALEKAYLHKNSCSFWGHATMWEHALTKHKIITIQTDGDSSILTRVGKVANGTQYPEITKLNLDNQNLDSSDHNWLGNMVGERAGCLEDLSMCNTDVTSSLINGISQNRTITALDLSSNSLSRCASSIASMLQGSTPLRVLTLDRSSIGSGAVTVVEVNTTVQCLHLSTVLMRGSELALNRAMVAMFAMHRRQSRPKFDVGLNKISRCLGLM